MSLKLNVGGEWDFCFDRENTGVEKQWFNAIPPKTKKIRLPHVWKMEQDYGSENVGFYYKTFTVDNTESAKRFFLRFESVHHFSTYWLNGESLGSHMGGYVPFDLNASKLVKIGEPNLLCVRVEAPNSDGKLQNRSTNELPVGSVYKKQPFAGILGDMHFLMGGRAGIQWINIFPDFEANRVTIETKFWNPKNYKAELEFTLIAPDGTTGTLPKQVKLEKENHTHSITLLVDDAKLWSPDNPQLYRLKVDLLGSYAWEKTFGIRRVETERGNFRINHENKRLRGINYQLHFPFYSAIPTFPLDFKEEFSRIQQSGFNLIRTNGVPFPNNLLDICDELGLMVIQETTCYNQKSSKEGLEELKSQLKNLVCDTGHHACIIAWGIGSENGSMALENGNKLLRYTSELDPYRPIISNFNSVILDSSGIAKIDLGKIFNPTDAKIEPFASHKFRIAQPISSRTQHLMTNYCSSKDAKSLNDGLHGNKSFWERYNYLKEEISGKILADGLSVWLPPDIDKLLDHPDAKLHKDDSSVQSAKALKKELESKVLDLGIWKSIEEFNEQLNKFGQQAIGGLIESFLINTQIAGYIFDQWSDTKNDFYGLVDWFHQPKPLLEFVKSMNQKCLIMSETEVRTPYIGTSAAMTIYLLNEIRLEEYGLLVRVKGPNGRIWHQESMPGVASPGINQLGRFKFPVGMERGWFTFDLALTRGKKEIAKKEEVFFVPDKVELDELLPQVTFKGKFPQTISYASNSQSHIILANQLSELSLPEVQFLLDQVENGKTLVCCNLNQDDAAILNKTKRLPCDLELFRSSWTGHACLHLAENVEELKNLPVNCIMSHSYADILPNWSLIPAENLNPILRCILISRSSSNGGYLKLGLNLASLGFGKGEIIFNQFKIFDVLGKNALADVMFYNLISKIQKKY